MLRTEWEAVLESNRAALVRAVQPLTDEQSRRRLVPSLTTPAGLVKHCAAAERVWFQRTIGGLAEGQCDGYARGDDGGWLVPPEQTLTQVIAEYQAAAARSRAIARTVADDDLFVHYRRGAVSFSWICAHMIEELARHAGHADILVEQILAADAAGQTRADRRSIPQSATEE
ncbi:DinB family protein [Rhodococcus sp. X156]|uniref:DinB family protein n=1 Tax=Rhodococcus sp. X156 TaxID=2499145 RepID=UPI000FD9EB04|nr:DinB family protein [Rhodococcus sp. X156]